MDMGRNCALNLFWWTDTLSCSPLGLLFAWLWLWFWGFVFVSVLVDKNVDGFQIIVGEFFYSSIIISKY